MHIGYKPSPRSWPLFRSFFNLLAGLFPLALRAAFPVVATIPFHSWSAVTENKFSIEKSKNKAHSWQCEFTWNPSDEDMILMKIW